MATKRRIGTAEARATLKDLVDEVKEKKVRVKITRYRRTAAYLVPKEEGQALEERDQPQPAPTKRKPRG